MENCDVKVGIADLNLVLPPGKIMTIGLGSCIGIAIYDKTKKIAGLAHIMLPNSTQFNNVTNPLKFADLAIPELIKKMESKGGRRVNFVAKIAGGASMFNFSENNVSSDIGKRNSEAVKEALAKEKIAIKGEHIGGKKGRTMIMDSKDGSVSVRIVGQEMIQL